MEIIKFSLNKQKISLIDCPVIASNSKDYLYASFELESEDWVKPIIAIFISEEKVPFSVTLDDDNMCKVPWEVLQYGNKVEVSAVCGDLHTATSVTFAFENSGYRNGNEPLEPTPTIWSELSKKIDSKQDKLIAGDGIKIEDNVISVVGGTEGTNGAKLGLLVFESYPYDWMYAIKDIRVTDGSTIAIGYVKRTSTRNAIVLYLVENGALSAAKLYANVDSDTTGYATYSNLAKTITMTVNWDEIPYNTNVQFGKNYVLCSAWCYGDTRLNYLLDKVKEEMNLNIVNKISSFVSTGKADKIVSNVQIVGMNHTDARLLISNFNRHYNGDDTDLLYIYTTDDTGATANLVKGVRVTEETGTATVDLSAIVSGAIMRFDYDFSGITDGTRLQVFLSRKIATVLKVYRNQILKIMRKKFRLILDFLKNLQSLVIHMQAVKFMLLMLHRVKDIL